GSMALAPLVGRGLGLAHVESPVHVLCRFAHREPTHGDPHPVPRLTDAGNGGAAQFGMDAALHDREERLWRRHEVRVTVVRREYRRPLGMHERVDRRASLTRETVELFAAAIQPAEAALHRTA